MPDDVILETRKLTKEFHGFVAVNSVDLRIRRGAIHALIGPNGAGKTTVFNLLTRFLPATSGSVIYRGEDITRLRPAAVARKGLVRSPDERRRAARIRSCLVHAWEPADRKSR